MRCSQCERRGKDCVFLPLTTTKRTTAKRAELDDDGQWRHNADDSQADGGVFALDGEDDMDVQGSEKRRKQRKPAANPLYMDEDEPKDGPGRFALPAAAALLNAANASGNHSLMNPIVLGNGGTIKHNMSDSALDASAALSQLSATATAAANTAASNFGFGGTPAGTKTAVATNVWMVAFAQGVSPFTSAAPFVPLEPHELQRILALDQDQLITLTPELLARSLTQCAMMAHGSRYTGNFDTSAQLATKAWELVKVCCGRKRVHNVAPLAQTIVASLELLVYYYIGASDFFRVRSLITQAYHLYVNHKQFLADSTAHRVLGLMIGASCSIEDIEFWLAKAKALNLQASTPFETSGWVVLALMLASTAIGTADRDTLPLRPRQMQDREFSHKIAVLHVIDESEKAVVFFENTPNCQADPHGQKVCKVHKAVLDGCRALILWQCGFEKEAATYVPRVLAVGQADNVSRLPHLMAISWTTQVARCLNLRAAFTKGMEYLEDGSFSYPYIRLLYEELKKPAILPEGATDDGSNHSMMGVSDDPSTPSNSFKSLSSNTASQPAHQAGNNAPAPTSGNSIFAARQGPAKLASASPLTSARVASGAPLLASKFDSGNTMSPRSEDDSSMNGITPMRPNPMKPASSLFNRGSVAHATAQSVSPQLQSVSPQLSMSPHLQGVSPHLLQGVSPLAQGLSPFTAIPNPLIQNHLVSHLNQFSPQIGGSLGGSLGGFLGVGSTFSPGALGQSTSPSWASATLPSEYLMDSTETGQPWS